jgi:putative hydrolase of the HAD superfamily
MLNGREPVEAVLFDLDDTLHDDTYAFTSAAEMVAHEIAAEHGVDALALKDAYIAEAEGFWTRLTPDQLQTKMSGLRERMWHSALAGFGLGDHALATRSADRYNHYRRTYLTLFPGALDLLRTLRARGVKVGMLTNGFAETHRDKIAVLELSDEFDAIFIADEVGMIKPDPLLFAYACAKLGRPPARSAMVGDRYERDVRGALDAGLYTIWMNVHRAALPAGAPPPHVTVDDLAGVRAVLL